ncbi:MAG: ArsR family transcriptional regulator [Candidatus Micrarchaeota archaeon]
MSLFFDFPNRKFQLRELERETKLSLPSVRNHVKSLEKQGFIKSVKTGVYSGYSLDSSEKSRVYKRNDLLARLWETGLIEEIEKACRPDCIVVFGSAAEGRDDERGDVDIFVQGRSKKISRESYEKKLNRKISFLFEPEIGKLNKELINSLANGVVLSGFLKVV